MANELTATLDFTAIKGFEVRRNLNRLNFDIAGDVYASGVISVGTSYELLDVGDVANLGYVYLRNLDGTNFISVAPDDGAAAASDPLARLRPGQFAWMPCEPAKDIWVKADTAACLMEYIVLPA